MLILLIALLILIGLYAARDTLRAYRALLTQLPSSNADFNGFPICEADEQRMSVDVRSAANHLTSTPAAHAA